MQASAWQLISKKELTELYARMPITAIAARYGITFGAVSHKLRTYGIKGGDVGKHTPGPKKSFDPPKSELEELYKSMSMAKIAAHYGVGETVIFNRLKNHGIGGITRSSRLKEHKKSDDHLRKIALTRRETGVMSGASNPNWKGGITRKSMAGRTLGAYADWKKAVLEKYSYKCSGCGVEQGYVCECCGNRTVLHTHHIKPYSEYPELRHDVDNGIALCSKCHW